MFVVFLVQGSKKLFLDSFDSEKKALEYAKELSHILRNGKILIGHLEVNV